MGSSDNSWFTSPTSLVNGFVNQNHPAQLPLFLNACKLLDLSLALPADSLPQMQMYRWAFVGDSASHYMPSSSSLDTQSVDMISMSENVSLQTDPFCSISSASSPYFEPHVVRITRLISASTPSAQVRNPSR